MTDAVPCPLCALRAQDALWSDNRCLVVKAHLPGIGDYCRVVWRDHVVEMSDLDRDARIHLLDVVCGVERTLRALARPTTMNLASLGNQVPHLHWHVIPRFADDPYFPDSIWAHARRAPAERRAWGDVLPSALAETLGRLSKNPL